jgi:hypothetical protein
MSWIDLPDDEATPELSRLTKPYRSEGRPTPAVIAAMKHNPRAMRGVLQMNFAATFGGSTLGQYREELIATTASALNDCFY